MAGPKHVVEIDCDGNAAQGINLVLSARLDQMLGLRDYALEWSDPEGVHQMRVASRRLRSGLKDFQPFLPRHSLTPARGEIKAMADALGSVRDQDVAILELDQLAAEAPEEVQLGILGFAELRRDLRDRARTQLIEALTPEALTTLRFRFAQALDAATATSTGRKRKRSKLPPENASYRDIARQVIRTRLNDLEKLSSSLYHPLEVKPLHRMRLAAKPLRYALELFEPCWGAPLSLFPKKMAALQTSLGKLHDCDVWIESFGAAMDSADPRYTTEHKHAAVWLIGHFVRLRSKSFNQALRQWTEWQAEARSYRLRAVIASEVALDNESSATNSSD